MVYTPVEVVDFILRSADELSRRHFGQGLTDEGVTILDPFTGTGTFIVRLLQSGIIRPEDLARKYASELWANEIMLLAYYIACVNIEATYEALSGSDEYVPFPGAIMTDSFQISEDGDRVDSSLIPKNNERITKQLESPITVILGNPPYSVGQTSANDFNANVAYPTLDGRIAETYAKRSTATNKNSLYDSYIRAYRWATDRLGDRGIVAYVSNGGWIDGNTADGMRLTMADEFAEIWIYNLRGNARTAGDLRQKEAGNVFESGSRNTVVVTLGVKKPGHNGPATIHYRDIGDYLDRDAKLARVSEATIKEEQWVEILPNASGDWLNQRDETFASFLPIASKTGEPAIFNLSTNGLKSNRDAWCYNFSEQGLRRNILRLLDTLDESIELGEPVSDPTRISWSGGLLAQLRRGHRHEFQGAQVRRSLYRPFTVQNAYFHRDMNERIYRLTSVMPELTTPNVGILVLEPNPRTPFAVVASDSLPDSKTFVDAAQFYARWTYEPGPKRAESEMLFTDGSELFDGFKRLDNISDHALAHFQHAFGPTVTKDDIFHYVYGVLHSPQYRQRFEADLKKMLPRIPLAKDLTDFRAFADAGKQLMDLHINYETVEPYPLGEEGKPQGAMSDLDYYAVGASKMKFPKVNGQVDRSRLIYNDRITLTGIPGEAHEYMLGSRSALEWIIDRYYIKTDKASGIVNDPNDWSREHDDPRYIIDLIGSVVTVAIETMKLVGRVPALPLDGTRSSHGGE